MGASPGLASLPRWTVKEGLAAGFALGLTLTIYGLANPNLAVVGKSGGRAQLLFE